MIPFPEIRALTFDCYGTLIDWESGILAALGPLLTRVTGRSWRDSEVLESYAGAEAQEESGPYRPYRQVLERVTRTLAGVDLKLEDTHALANSVKDWPAFPDTPAALSLLATRYRLMILSNIDRDLFEGTRPRLGPAPLELVSAEGVRAYKPNPAHFHEGLRRLALNVNQVCHVAQSRYHDIPVAQSLGFHTVWVNRRSSRQGPGATPAATATPDLEVPDLATLAEIAVSS